MIRKWQPLPVELSDNGKMSKPVYLVEIWPEPPHWLARVCGIGRGADGKAIGYMTEAYSREEIEDMARDLIECITDECTFDIEFFERGSEPVDG